MSLDLTLDLGSAYTRVASPSGALVLEEPTIAAVNEDSGKMLAFGTDALGLGASCAGRVRLRHPVHHGQLVDLDLADQVVDEVLSRAGATRLNRSRVVATTHTDATGVQRRALERALRRAGARQVRFVEQPLACAIGRGLAIEEPLGQMVVDVGGGTTDVAVIALGGIVSSVAVPLGCDDLDETLRELLARRADVVIEHRTAAEIRQHLAAILAPGSTESLEITGRDRRHGTMRSVVVGRSALSEALEQLVGPVLAAASACIMDTPPDLANDLLGTGVVLCGGGSYLYGLDARLAATTGVPVHVAGEHGALGVLGAAACLADLDALAPSLSAAGRR